ncbi:MAG TPA: malto-oligosyltrehalose synthase [Nocardioidaceae bacterium]|nr:malto-oligosyltrehalose synthase [Nocardioidaceae bacterium]
MIATYRLQLHAGFTFADAEARVPYLAALGVSHLYLSPILQAVPGSQHGYDVLDHTRVNDELGGEDGLVSLAETARSHGLGIVVDVVPNHMAFVAPEHANAPLWQTLRDGRDAETAHWFDIDWDADEGKLGLPILGGTLEEALASGEVTLDEYDGQPVVRYYDHVLPVAPGTEGDDIAEVLARQHYVLANWRDSDAMLNYRRFFDVTELIAVRVELPDVFEATHRLLLDLNRRGIVEGFRIDHPDGLADPEGYLRQLREAAMPGSGIWVEKILEGDERLPRSWPCDGTTGYDAMRAVTAALVDPAALAVLDEAWAEAGSGPDLEHAVERAKRKVVDELLGPEVQRLTRRACDALPDLDEQRTREAVVELLVASEVYRAYIRPDERLSPLARKRLKHSLEEAAAARPDLVRELEQLADLAKAENPDDDSSLDFAIRLQQTWGPVMAKGIEDTTFYRWHRLVALNEVGGDPASLEQASPSILHDWAANQQDAWPLGMTTLSTHDTKRSEDVRARLVAVAQDTMAWEDCSKLYREAADEAGVDRPTAHLIWQTLVGAGPLPHDRLHGYLTKAMREAKRHTSWVDVNAEYEARVLAFADQAAAPGPLRAAVDEAVLENQQCIRATVLGQKLLQLLLPGTADTYQGCEVVNLSLVDPDNRRPVDFDDLEDRLARLEKEAPISMADEKMLVTSRALRVRRELRDCFGDRATYVPLVTSTEHAIGFVRTGRVVCAATRAPRRLVDAGGWSDQTVSLPEGTWRDDLTGRLFDGGRDVLCHDLFAQLPVALLVAR